MNNKDIYLIGEAYKKQVLLPKRLKLNEYSNPFIGATGDDFDKIQHKLSPQQKETIKNLDRSVDYVFTYWDDQNQTISIESIDTHNMRRHTLKIDKDGNIMTADDIERMRKKNLKPYPKPKRLSINKSI